MQSKGLIKFFTIAFILVCLYQLSFSWKANQVENDAQEYAESGFTSTDLEENATAKIVRAKKKSYLDSIAGQPVYNLLFKEFTYAEVRKNKLGLGLDLKGGISVVLQVSVEDLLKALSNQNANPAFETALDKANTRLAAGEEDYINLFVQSFKETAPGAELKTLFATLENKEFVDFNSTDAEVIEFLREESDKSVGRAFEIIRQRIDRFGVAQPNISLDNATGRIYVELPGAEDQERVRNLLQATANLEFWETFDNIEVYNNYMVNANTSLAAKLNAEKELEQGKTVVDTNKVSDVLNEVSDVVNGIEKDTSELSDELGSLLEGDTSSTDTAALRAEFQKDNPLFSLLSPNTYRDENGQTLLGQGPVVGYSLAIDTAQVNKYFTYPEVRANFPKNIRFVWGAKAIGETGTYFALYAIKTKINDLAPKLDGGSVVDANWDVDQTNRNEVVMRMNSEGANIWKKMTEQNVGKSIAVVLDNAVYTAPNVNTAISGGVSSITGDFSIDEAKDLANILKTGKLPARTFIVEEQIVGPSLGADNINSGLMSLLAGVVIVLLFMVAYYGGGGIVSIIALLLNVFFIIGTLSSIGGVLTLSGIAGIVLTIGMAVDANVIIFERIREELEAGRPVRNAVAQGFSNSYSAIIDANITTMITAIILMIFGAGPILGFATVLVIGIIASVFSAVLVGRLLIETWLENKERSMSFFTGMSKSLFSNISANLVAKRKTAYIISGIIILVGIGSMAMRGFELGVDFKGGRTYTVQFDETTDVDAVANSLTSLLGNQRPTVKTVGTDNQLKITTSYLIEDNSQETGDKIDQLMYEGLKTYLGADIDFETFNKKNKLSAQKVGPTIASDIKAGALKATFFAIIAIFLYIFVRFRKWQFGLGAVAAVTHDVLVILGLFSLFYGILPFSLEIDQAFIAAILTVIGYSINDTVVVFDRIREELIANPKKAFIDVVDMAINRTLSRTIITSLTTLFVVLILFIFGGQVIQGFAFALLVGIIVGTYSSIFIATPVVIETMDEKTLAAASQPKPKKKKQASA